AGLPARRRGGGRSRGLRRQHDRPAGRHPRPAAARACGVVGAMSSTTRIVAQLAPQRSTQYSNLARDLAEAELLASPIGSRLQDVSLRNIAGQDYVQFSLPDPITSETARLLASMAMLGGIFEAFDSIGDVSGPLLRPVPAAHAAFVSPDMAATRRYKGKTNEAFTH